jgi:hypothetical protein
MGSYKITDYFVRPGISQNHKELSLVYALTRRKFETAKSDFERTKHIHLNLKFNQLFVDAT